MFYNHQEVEIVKIASTYIMGYKWNNTLTNLSIFNLLLNWGKHLVTC